MCGIRELSGPPTSISMKASLEITNVYYFNFPAPDFTYFISNFYWMGEQKVELTAKRYVYTHTHEHTHVYTDIHIGCFQELVNRHLAGMV